MDDNTQDEKIENQDDERAVYELGYHLFPTLVEDQVSEGVSNIKSIIEKSGGIFVSEESPKQIDLAYTIVQREGGKRIKFDSAYFGWMKFEIPIQNITATEETFRANKQILRFLLIKTIRESTLAPKKLIFNKPTESSTPPPPAPTIIVKKEEKDKGGTRALSEEELDKTIEELVAE